MLRIAAKYMPIKIVNSLAELDDCVRLKFPATRIKYKNYNLMDALYVVLKETTKWNILKEFVNAICHIVI